MDALAAGRLIVCILLPACAAALFERLDTKTAFRQWSRARRQMIIGAVFGVLAVVSTELGITISGATINVRDAAPLAAGLLFGGPAGIAAGLIGGAERWFAASWGAGVYTREACTIATICAGCIGALLHRALFSERRPSWWYALTIACGVEVLHMLLIFLTNMSDPETAYSYIRRCALIMIAGNGLSVLAATLAIRPRRTQSAVRGLEHILQLRLFICVVIALAATTVFTWILQTSIVSEETTDLLRVALRDVPQEVNDIVDSGLAEYTDWMSEEAVMNGASHEESLAAAQSYGIPYIFVLDGSVIVQSSDPALIGRDLADLPRARALFASDDEAYVSALEPSYFDPTLRVKYVAVRLDNGDRFVAGYSTAFLSRELRRRIGLGALHRHIGQGGYIVLADADGRIVSGALDSESTLQDMGFSLGQSPRTLHETTANGTRVYYMYAAINTIAGRYIVVAAQPAEEATFAASLAIWLSVFFEILIFLTLLIQLTILLRRRVVQEMHAVNDVLARITAGELDEKAEVRSSDEFVLLSDGINQTTNTLKGYIAQAAARIDQELEFARTVQRAALPAVFPPYPERTDFDICASMDAAKIVGGDFYDFYLRSDTELVFLIADVSGKGIPAAMFMMRAMTQLRNLAQSGLTPAEVFRRANNALSEQNDAQMFLTAWMGMLDLTNGTLRYVNAGHNPVLLRETDGSVRYIKSTAGFVLAGIENFPYEEGQMDLRPGQTVLLYTDGVTEAENARQEQFGPERLLESARRAPEGAKGFCDAVRKDVDAFCGDVEQFDDLTMMALCVNALASPEHIVLRADQAAHRFVQAYAERRLEQMNVPADTASEIARALASAAEEAAAQASGEMKISLGRTDEAVSAHIDADWSGAHRPEALCGGRAEKAGDGRWVLSFSWQLESGSG